MRDWDLYQLDCEFIGKRPTFFGFVLTELWLLRRRLWERIDD